MARQEQSDAATASNAAASAGDSNNRADEKKLQGATAAKAASGAEAAVTTDGIDLLKADHRKVEALFEEYDKAAPARKTAIIQEACADLILHTRLEEEIFYPACRKAGAGEEPLNEAQVEHDGAKVLIADLLASDQDDPYRDAKFKVLSEQIKHHVAEEEEPKIGIFAKARGAGIDAEALGRQLRQRKDALKAHGGQPRPTALVALNVSNLSPGQQQEESMARQQGNRDRDDQGRFTSDDRGRSSSSRREDDRVYRSSSRDDDGRGWYGDSEGHAEASRRGWAARQGGEFRSFRDDDRGYGSRGGADRDRDQRGRFISDDDRGGYSSRGRDRDDDDRGYRSRGGDDRDRDDRGRFTRDDDDRGGYRSRGGDNDRDRDERGRFASDDDDRGYRSRDRDEDDRGGRGRGQGGWFGDSEGHAQAARQGWEDRGGSRSRGRGDDDDRGGRGRGQGGWFGDREGHAEAARRGWEDRR